MGNTSSHIQPQWAPGFPTQRHYYHAVSRALSHGSPGDPRNGVLRRAPLPTELVLLILRQAGATVPFRDLSCAFPSDVSLKDIETTAETLDRCLVVSAINQSVRRRILFASPVVELSMLSRLAWLRVDTFSRDQGWCSDLSWSWVEVGIVRLADERNGPFKSLENRKLHIFPFPEELDLEGSKRWESHRNPISGRGYTWVEGAEFGPDHEMWSLLQPGDRIGVWMCAQFPGWQCMAKAARITVRQWFDPTLL